jgi:hypothetical protein
MDPRPSTPDHRRRARRIAVGLTILALLATACSGTSGSNGDAPAQATTTAVALQPLEQPSSRCGTPPLPRRPWSASRRPTGPA